MHRLKRGEPLSDSHSYWRWGLTLFSVYLFLGGCGTVQSLNPSARKPAGPPAGARAGIAEPTTWVLIKNPRFGSVEGVESVPEHIWVQEDQVPWTLNSLVHGEDGVLAPSPIVAQYGPPPENGKISPKQGGPPARGMSIRDLLDRLVTRPSTPLDGRPGEIILVHPVTGEFLGVLEAPPASKAIPRGYVIHVGEGRVVVDLMGRDGMKRGILLNVYRGEVKTEIGVLEITEVRDHFSLAQVRELTPGFNIDVKDRVAVRP